MTTGDITAIFIALAALIGVMFTYLTYRNGTKRQRIQDAKDREDQRVQDAKDRAEASGVTLSKINTSISNERDRAEKALEETVARHAEEIERLRREHNQEIEDLRGHFEADALETKRLYDKRIEELSKRLAACQTKVNGLYEELHELQKLLPPNLRPQFPPPSTGE